MQDEHLDPHAVIAWDMDGTLIDGPNGAYFCQYIVANPQKQHHIVTFRTPRAWAEFSPFELAPYGITRSMIAGIHNVPDELYHAYAQRLTFFQPEKVEAYFEWKGLKSKEIGATVLVDDMPNHVLPGCQKYGITYVDSHGTFPIVAVPWMSPVAPPR